MTKRSHNTYNNLELTVWLGLHKKMFYIERKGPDKLINLFASVAEGWDTVRNKSKIEFNREKELKRKFVILLILIKVILRLVLIDLAREEQL